MCESVSEIRSEFECILLIAQARVVARVGREMRSVRTIQKHFAPLIRSNDLYACTYAMIVCYKSLTPTRDSATVDPPLDNRRDATRHATIETY